MSTSAPSTTTLDDIDVFDFFDVDVKSTREGIWIKFGKSKIKMVHASNANKLFEARYSAAMRPHRRAEAKGKLPEDVVREALMPVYIDLIFTDWEGIPLERGGQPVEYNRENAKAVFTRLPKFFDECVGMANDYTNFQSVASDGEEDVKNS